MHCDRDLMNRRNFLGATVAGAAASLHAASAGQWKIGCYTRPWDKFEYRVALDGMAEAGFKYAGLMSHRGKPWILVNPDTPVEEVAAMGEEVRKRGMETISIYGSGFAVEKSVEAGITGLRRLIDNCAAARCPALLLGGTGKADLVDAYYKVIKECCDYAASKKVGMSVKPHGGANATGPECRKIIEKVGHKNFGLWYDPGNIFYYSEGKVDPVDDALTVNGLVVGMSVKDYKPPKEVQVTPGTGKVNFPEVFARLRKGGFTRGPLVVECLNPGDTPAAVTAEARKARQLLLELTAS